MRAQYPYGAVAIFETLDHTEIRYAFFDRVDE